MCIWSGRRPDPGFEKPFFCLFTQPDPTHIVAAMISENFTNTRPEQGAIIDHATHTRQHSGMGEYCPVESFRTSRVKQYWLGLRRPDLSPRTCAMAKRSMTAARSRQAQYSSTGPPGRKAIGEPIAAILGVIAGERGEAGMKRCFARQFNIGIRCHSISHCSLRIFLDQRRVLIWISGWIQPVSHASISSGRGEDTQARSDQCAHQDVIARPRPRLRRGRADCCGRCLCL